MIGLHQTMEQFVTNIPEFSKRWDEELSFWSPDYPSPSRMYAVLANFTYARLANPGLLKRILAEVETHLENKLLLEAATAYFLEELFEFCNYKVNFDLNLFIDNLGPKSRGSISKLDPALISRGTDTRTESLLITLHPPSIN